MKFALPVRRTLSALAALGVIAACQSSDVSSPSVRPPSSPAAAKLSGAAPRGIGFMGNEANDFHAARCATTRSTTASGLFGPAGGTLQFGNSRLIIPGGALRDTVTISATIVDSASSHVEFRPHGLEFATPAGLLLATDGCVLSSDDAPTVVYLSAEGIVLETIPAIYDPRWKTFAAAIHHFSGYAIAF